VSTHADAWQQCLNHLEGELSTQQFNTWIRPLQVMEDSQQLRLLAPNRFVLDWVNTRLLERIEQLLGEISGTPAENKVVLEIGGNIPDILNTPRHDRAAASAGRLWLPAVKLGRWFAM